MNESDPINETTILKPAFALATNRQLEYGSSIPVTDAISPRDLLSSISRNKGLIISIILCFFVAVFFLLSIIPPRYTSDVLMMIKSHDVNAKTGSIVSNESIENEIEVIKSRALTVKVIKLLNLDKNPEFNSFLKENTSAAKAFNLDPYLANFEKLPSGQYPSTYNPDEVKQVEELLKSYYDGLSIARKGISQVILIRYTAQNPVTATNIVNAIADQYIHYQLETKYKEAGKTTEWLVERIKPLQKKVEESETAVESFRKNSGLLESGGSTLTSQHLAKLHNQLIQAEQKHDETRARLRQINQLIKSPQGASTISEVMQSPLIQHLRVKESKLQQELSELSTEYGSNHPTMIQLRAEIEDLNSALKQEILNINSSLKNEAALASTQKFSAQQRLNQLKEEVAKSNTATVELRALEREAKADRELFETFLARLKEALNQQDIDVHQPNAQILSRGIMPVTSSFPKKVPILALTIIGSTILAMLFVLVRESIDRGLYTVGLVEEQTGFPSLGYIPAIRKRDALGRSPTAYQVKLPQSSFSRSIKTLYTNIVLSNPANPPKSILITSAQHKEGKTTVAKTLAMSRSLIGQKTIIIDTYFKISKSKKTHKGKPLLGLAELLTGEATLEKVILRNAKTGTDKIIAGSLLQNPADLLMSENMDILLRLLSERYGLIIIDTPPALDAPNARILISKVDATIFVAKWNHTKRQLIREALRYIAVPGNNIIGVLINMVNEKKQASYGYASSNYTYGEQAQNKLLTTKKLKGVGL